MRMCVVLCFDFIALVQSCGIFRVAGVCMFVWIRLLLLQLLLGLIWLISFVGIYLASSALRVVAVSGGRRPDGRRRHQSATTAAPNRDASAATSNRAPGDRTRSRSGCPATLLAAV